jgi:hypothetical protein
MADFGSNGPQSAREPEYFGRNCRSMVAWDNPRAEYYRDTASLSQSIRAAGLFASSIIIST